MLKKTLEVWFITCDFLWQGKNKTYFQLVLPLDLNTPTNKEAFDYNGFPEWKLMANAWDQWVMDFRKMFNHRKCKQLLIKINPVNVTTRTTYFLYFGRKESASLKSVNVFTITKGEWKWILQIYRGNENRTQGQTCLQNLSR